MFYGENVYPQHVCIEYPQHIFYEEMEKMNIHNIYMYGVSTTYVLWRNGETVYQQHMYVWSIHNLCFMKKWRKCVFKTYVCMEYPQHVL